MFFLLLYFLFALRLDESVMSMLPLCHHQFRFSFSSSCCRCFYGSEMFFVARKEDDANRLLRADKKIYINERGASTTHQSDDDNHLALDFYMLCAVSRTAQSVSIGVTLGFICRLPRLWSIILILFIDFVRQTIWNRQDTRQSRGYKRANRALMIVND